jgi:hypothetical protein
MKSIDCAPRLQAKCSEPAMTHSVTPFRQNTATSALFFARDVMADAGSLQQFEKTMLIGKGEAPKNPRWQEKCSKPNVRYSLNAPKEEE